jgi:hypothetical protein
MAPTMRYVLEELDQPERDNGDPRRPEMVREVASRRGHAVAV